jgi:hypothetical protein
MNVRSMKNTRSSELEVLKGTKAPEPISPYGFTLRFDEPVQVLERPFQKGRRPSSVIF